MLAVPVKFVTVPLEGVPKAPLNKTGAPAEPVLIAKAVAMPVPSPDTPVDIGNPTALVRVVVAATVPKAVALPEASRFTLFPAGYTTNTSFVPAAKLIADGSVPELLDKTVVRARVVPEDE